MIKIEGEKISTTTRAEALQAASGQPGQETET